MLGLVVFIQVQGRRFDELEWTTTFHLGSPGQEAQLSQASEEEQRTEDQQTWVIYAAGRSRS